MMRAALYLRVSNLDQHPQPHLHDLRQIATQRGYEVVKEYTDRASGSKAKRPALDDLLSDTRRRKFDVVLTPSLAQMARSVRHCLSILNQLAELGIGLASCRENIDTTGAMGQAFAVVINALSALERNLRIENVRAGMRRSKLEGGRFGRKPISCDRVAIVSDRLSGMSLTDVGKKHGVSRGTVCRLVKLAGGRPDSLPPCIEHPFYTAAARAVPNSGEIQ